MVGGALSEFMGLLLSDTIVNHIIPSSRDASGHSRFWGQYIRGHGPYYPAYGIEIAASMPMQVRARDCRACNWTQTVSAIQFYAVHIDWVGSDITRAFETVSVPKRISPPSLHATSVLDPPAATMQALASARSRSFIVGSWHPQFILPRSRCKSARLPKPCRLAAPAGTQCCHDLETFLATHTAPSFASLFKSTAVGLQVPQQAWPWVTQSPSAS
jgi:hypothetical protein